MKLLFIIFAIVFNSEISGQSIFRHVNIYPNGTIYLDSTIKIDNKHLIVRNDSVVELAKNSFSGCERIVINLDLSKRVRSILFYYAP